VTSVPVVPPSVTATVVDVVARDRVVVN